MAKVVGEGYCAYIPAVTHIIAGRHIAGGASATVHEEPAVCFWGAGTVPVEMPAAVPGFLAQTALTLDELLKVPA